MEMLCISGLCIFRAAQSIRALALIGIPIRIENITAVLNESIAKSVAAMDILRSDFLQHLMTGDRVHYSEET